MRVESKRKVHAHRPPLTNSMHKKVNAIFDEKDLILALALLFNIV